MLQNACRALWNMTQTVLMRVVAGTLHIAEDPLAEGSTDIDVLRKALWQKFYFGADRLLDMMVLIQDQAKTESEQNKKVGIFCVIGGRGEGGEWRTLSLSQLDSPDPFPPPTRCFILTIPSFAVNFL